MAVLAAAVPDVQGSRDTRQIPIQKVGVRGLRSPVRIRAREGGWQATVADVQMYVDLDAGQKGAHMSRFLELLGEGWVIDVAGLRELLRQTAQRLQAQTAHVELRFPFFMQKRAPVSGSQSLLDYEVSLSGVLRAGHAEVSVQVAVPVTSLCPCSKAISRYGAHNQRSRVTVTVRSAGFIWIEELIELVEAQACCELYPLLKRADEQYVTEKAYDNPKFVEDMVRDVAACLEQDERVLGYAVACENFESIHNHSAYALIEKDCAR
jgi:GTP cyclohydrolase IB